MRGAQKLFALLARGPADTVSTLLMRNGSMTVLVSMNSPYVISMLALLAGRRSDRGHREGFLPDLAAWLASRLASRLFSRGMCRIEKSIDRASLRQVQLSE